MALSIDDVKDYLLETQAIEEAESILLKNILDKSNDNLRRRVVKDSLQPPTSDDNGKDPAAKTVRLDHLKISELLGQHESDLEHREHEKLQQRARLRTLDSDGASRGLTKKERLENKLEKLKLVDEIAAQELGALEQQREWIQLKKEANGEELQKFRVIHGIRDQDAASNRHGGFVDARRAGPPIIFAGGARDHMDRLHRLTEEHARKMAQTRSESLALEQERRLLEAGKWNIDASYMRNQGKVSEISPPEAVHGNTDSASADVISTSAADGVTTRLSSSEISGGAEVGEAGAGAGAEQNARGPMQRVASLLRVAGDASTLASRREEISSLRRQAADVASDALADPAMQLPPRFSNERRTIEGTTHTNGAQQQAQQNQHLVNRNMTVPDYLDSWLKSFPAENSKSSLSNMQPGTLTSGAGARAGAGAGLGFSAGQSRALRQGALQQLGNAAAPVDLSSSADQDSSYDVATAAAAAHFGSARAPLQTVQRSRSMPDPPLPVNGDASGCGISSSIVGDLDLSSIGGGDAQAIIAQLLEENKKLRGGYNNITSQDSQSHQQQQQGLQAGNQYPQLNRDRESGLGMRSNPRYSEPYSSPYRPPDAGAVAQQFQPYYPMGGGGGVGGGPHPGHLSYPNIGGGVMMGGAPPMGAFGGAPGWGAPAAPTAAADPTMSQLQQMAARIEQENTRLLGQMHGLGSGGGGRGPAGGWDEEEDVDPTNLAYNHAREQHSSPVRLPSGADVFNSPYQRRGHNRNPALDNARLYPLQRDRQRGGRGGGGGDGGGMLQHRQEMQYNEEIRTLQHEIEKVRYMQELDDTKADFERQRAVREKDLAHERWLQEQKQELQAIKLQQMLAKEQLLLKLQQEELSGAAAGGGMGSGWGGAGADGGVPDAKHELLREESGVGRSPRPLSQAKGVVVAVDAILIDKQQQVGQFYRVALGLYDAAGKPLVRLSASAWQVWNQVPEASPDSSSGSAGRGGSASGGSAALSERTVQQLRVPVMRELKLSEVSVDQLANSRCLLELQTKDEIDGVQKWIGWAAVPLVTSAPAASASSGTGAGIRPSTGAFAGAPMLLRNNAWRGCVRRGLSDPAYPNLLAPVESVLEGAWLLLRIADLGELPRVTSWALSSSSLRSSADMLSFYRDPMVPEQRRPSAAEAGQDAVGPLVRGASISAFRGLSGRMNSAAGHGSLTPMAAGAGSGAGTVNRQNSLKSIASGVVAARSMLQRGESSSNVSSLMASGGDDSSTHHNPGMHALAQSIAAVLPSHRGDQNQALDGGMAPLSRRVSRMDSARSVATPLQGFTALSKVVEELGTGSAAEGEGESAKMPSARARAADEKAYWFMGAPSGPCSDRYERGDGVDVYIDGALNLPDNCTVTRVVMRLFTADKEQVGNVFEGLSHPTSVSLSPSFKLRAELRSNQFDATVTMLIRVDTIDAATLNPASVGYACCKVFASRDRVQPKTANEQAVYINTGLFQLPLHAGRIPSNLEAFSERMLDGLPKVPCATLLVRVVPAPKSSDGITTLSRDEFPPEEWTRLGLDVPAPTYSSGAYNGSLCEPTADELICFRAKDANVTESAESAVLQALSSLPAAKSRFPPKPAEAAAPETIEWFRKLFPKHDQIRKPVEYAFTAPYAVEKGLCVAIEKLYNMPDLGLFSSQVALYKVISSTSPPGLFYKDPPLFDGVYYTKSNNLESHVRAPAFSDGFQPFTPANMDGNLYLILDVRTIHLSPAKKDAAGDAHVAVTVEPAVARKSYWTLLPLSMEKIPGQGFKYAQSGVFQLPLMEGAPPLEGIFKAGNPYRELLARLSSRGKEKDATGAPAPIGTLRVAEGMSMVVKVMNPLLKGLVQPDLDSPSPNVQTIFMNTLLDSAATGTSGGSARKEKFALDPAKYSLDTAKHANKLISQHLPKTVEDVPQLMKAVNKTFESETGLHVN